MIPAYRLKEIFIKSTSIRARPIEWDRIDVDGQGHDKDGEDVYPTKWHTTCPHCANLLEFEAKDIYKLNENENVGCTNCWVGEKPDGIDWSNPVDVEELLSKIDIAEFCDPIISGNFDIEIDHDKLAIIAEFA